MKKMIDYRTVAGLVILTLCATGQAREDVPPASQKVSFDITAPSMVQALIQFTQQSGLQLAFPTKGTDDLSAPQVVGEYTPAAALDHLLKNSGLRYEFANERTVSVRAAGRVRLAEAGTPSPLKGEGRGEDGRTSSQRESRGEENAGMASADIRGIPEVLVRGKKTLNADVERTRDDARPYVVFKRDEIERSGAQNLEDFFRKSLTSAVSGSIVNNQVSSPRGNASQIDLGGLGKNQTLILVDGRRMAGFFTFGSPNQPDINGIPLSAIERIEVLRSSASGIYGGGATGGVVNIIIRRDYAGAEGKFTYENTADGGAMRRRVDLTGGYAFGKTSFIVAAAYSDSSPLFIADRDLAQRGRERVLQNDPGTFYRTPFAIPLGATTNITSANGAPLTLKSAFGGASLGSSRTFVPYGYTGSASDMGAALVANAGRYNFDLAGTNQSAGGHAALLTAPTLRSVLGTVRQEITPRINVFLEAATSQNIGSFHLGAAPVSFSLSSTAASNPFNQNILVAVPIAGIDQDLEVKLKSNRIAAGVTANVTTNWVAGLDYTWNRSTIETAAADYFNTTAATSLMAAGTANVFRDVNAFPVDLTSAAYPDLTPGSEVNTTLKDATLRLSGPVRWTLPGGAPTLSMALENRKESVDQFIMRSATSPTTFTTRLFPDQSQSVDSAYVEMVLPLVSTRSPVRMIDTLELQLAARHDRYTTRGVNNVLLDANSQPQSPIVRRENKVDSTDPSIALRYKPVRALMIRGSFGTGFLPPAVDQIVPSATPVFVSAATATALGLTDPERNNEPLGAAGPVAVTTGGNSSLRPEDSRSWSAGIVLTPHFAPDLRLSLDWTRIKKRDTIVSIPINTPGLIALLNGGAPERITRAPATSGVGPVTALDLTALNFSASETEAYDLALDYTLHTSSAGRFTFSSSVTDLVHSKSRLTPLSPFVENAGVLTNFFGILRWKATAGLKWEYGSWTSAWTTRYYDSYFLNTDHTVVAAQGAASVPSQTYHDLMASYKPQVAGLLSNLAVQAGVTNVLNKKPPFQAQTLNQAYYSTVGDPRLATYYISVSKAFH